MESFLSDMSLFFAFVFEQLLAFSSFMTESIIGRILIYTLVLVVVASVFLSIIGKIKH